MWLIFRSIDFESNRLTSVMWMGLIQSLEGLKSKGRLPKEEAILSHAYNIEATLEFPTCWSQTQGCTAMSSSNPSLLLSAQWSHGPILYISLVLFLRNTWLMHREIEWIYEVCLKYGYWQKVTIQIVRKPTWIFQKSYWQRDQKLD